MRLFTVKYQDMYLTRYKILDNKGNFTLVFSKDDKEYFDEDDYILVLCQKQLDCSIESDEESPEKSSDEMQMLDWM